MRWDATPHARHAAPQPSDPATAQIDAKRRFDAAIAGVGAGLSDILWRSEEHTSELQSLMRISYAVFCLKKKTPTEQRTSRATKQSQIPPTRTTALTTLPT